jgi:hypothetical protein
MDARDVLRPPPYKSLSRCASLPTALSRRNLPTVFRQNQRCQLVGQPTPTLTGLNTLTWRGAKSILQRDLE